ncbi:MAG: hypothetical protein ACRDA2_00025, partial [Cetobacterium sp.]
MKRKSYNFIGASCVIFIIISLIFFLVIKNNKFNEKESTFLKKITVSNNNIIDFNKLTPLEKEVWEKFEKIPKSEYSFRYEEIAENNRVLLNIHSKENIGAYILKEVLNSDELSPNAKLYILNKLRVLDATTGNIVNSIKLTMEYFNLAEELGSEADIIRAQIALSSIFNSLGGHEISIKILQDINIENKNFPGISKIKITLYLYLAENFGFLNNTAEGFKYLNKVTPLLNTQPESYKQNILILKNLLEARLNIMSNNKDEALKCLNIATSILNNLEKVFFTDLDNFLLITRETYYLKYEPEKFSPNTLKNFIGHADFYGDVVFLKIAFNLLFQYYYDLDNFKEYAKLSKMYDEYLERVNVTNNKVFSLYLI